MNKQRKTSHILNVFQYDADGHVILPASLTLSIAPASGDNNSKVPTTAWVRAFVSGLNYVTGNQSITVSGDATGSGTTSIELTLANTAVTPGIYGSSTLVPVVTVDSKGRITNVSTASISGALTFTGDVTGTGTTGSSTGLTLANSGVTAGTYTKVTVDSKGRVTVGASATTSDIAEGTNLYYTDARVGSYLTANNYATQSYVGTQIANLVDAAPGTLDTLNELAAALGDDPNFATTVATSIGTKQAQLNGTGFVKVTGTTVSYDNSTYLTTSSAASTYVSLSGSYANPAWITSLGWGKITGTPTTISGYGITNAYTDAQIQNFFNGANAITGYNKSNWDTAYGWGNHASAGYLTSYTETDTLSSVTSRGASTSTAVTFSTSATIGRVLIDYDGTDSWFRMQSGNRMRITTTGGTDFIIPNTGNMTYNGNTVWHSGNLTNLNQLGNGPGYLTSIIAHNQAWSTITSTPTTLSGYGITDGLYTTTSDFTTAGTGWYRVATTAGDGRGYYYVELYTTGGNHNPSYLRIEAMGDWGNDKLIAAYTDLGFPANTVRITRTATTTFLEVNFTSTILGASMRVVRLGFNTSVSVLSGALSAGGGTVQETLTIAGKINAASMSIAGNTVLHAGNYSSYALPLSGGTISGTVTINGAGAHPLAISSSQRYQLQVRNTNNSVNSGYGWWWFMDTNFNMGFHADGAADRLTLTRDGNFSVSGTISTSSNIETTGGSSYLRVSGITNGSFIELSGNLPGYTNAAYPVIKSAGTIHFANNNKYSAFLEGANTYFGILDNTITTRVFLATSGTTYFTGGNVAIGNTTADFGLHVNRNQNQVAGFQSPNANTWVDIISTAGTWSMGATASNTWAIYQRGAANATRFEVGASSVNTTGTMYAAAFRGNANVSGTGEAIYAPAGLYSTGTNWLYGTMYLNVNSINDTADIRTYNSGYSFRARYTAGSDIYHSSLNWYGLQLGNNGDNYIIGGRTATGGNLTFYVNNTSDFTSINGVFAAKMHSTGRTSFGQNSDNGYQVQVYGSLYASDWIRVAGSQGLYFESYGGGWRMTDSSYIRSYNAKALSMEGASVDYVGSIYMNGGVYIQTNNNRNLLVKSSGAADCGILGRGNGDQFAFQIYGSGGDYGFLDGAWAAWDLRKTVDGRLYMNDNNSYYLQTESSSRVYHIHADYLSVGQGINTSYRIITNGDYYANGGGNFWAEGRFKQYRGSGSWHDVIDSGNISSQSVSYASSAGSAGSASVAGYLQTLYAGGVQSNPQTYFGQSVGLRVAMTGHWSVWSDTLWINGYAGGDVLQMCALHTLRNGTPRMAISVQASTSSSYGTIYEFLTTYNAGYAYNMNQHVRTSDGPTFTNIYNNGWFRNNNTNEGVYNQVTGTHFYSSNGSGWTVTGSGGTVEIVFRSNHQSTLRGYVYGDTSSNFGLLDNTGNWQVRLNPNNNGGQLYGNWLISGAIRRSSHSTGFLEGSYNNIGGNSAYTNPIYTIGSSYNPTDSSLQSMYGIGYSHPNFWGSGKTPSWGLYVCEGGTINATIGGGSTTIWAQNDIVAYSDARVKDNIEVVENAVEKIQAIRGVTFTRTDANDKDRNKRHAGVIAQEVLKVLPEVVSGTEEDMYSVAYGNMAALFIEAIKEQQKQIEELQNKLDNVLSSR